MEPTLEEITGVLELLIVPIFLIELVWLHRRGELTWPRVKEMLASASAFLFVIAGAVLTLALWAALFGAIAAARSWAIPTTFWSAILAVVIADLIYYWEHRFEHEKRLPWDLYHSVHHSSPNYDQTTSLRLGLFDGMLTTLFLTPMVIVGFSPSLTLIASGVVIGYQTWFHTEVIQKMPRWYEAVFNAPAHHRAHHGADDIYLDVNYGGILIIWDRMFGTFQAEVQRPVYGLTTQIESSNPLDVQFSQLKLLWRDLKSDDSWRIRLRRLWEAPGWTPQPAS